MPTSSAAPAESSRKTPFASLVISRYLLGTEEFMAKNRADCGLMCASEQDLRTRIQNHTGTAVSRAFSYAFQNNQETVPIQLQKLPTHR